MHSRDLSHALRRLLYFGVLAQDIEATISFLIHQRLITLRSNEKMYRTAVFAVKDGAISCSQPLMEELTKSHVRLHLPSAGELFTLWSRNC